MTALADIWPPFALRVTAGALELHPVTDAEPDRIGPNTAAYSWQLRAAFGPRTWTLDLAVRVDGELVGVQGFHTVDYLVTRTGETGSWLVRSRQGQGIGTRMRQAMCALLFDHLDAVEITSGAFTDNPASLAVSRKVGYVDNGMVRVQRRQGEVALNRKLLLTPDRFVRGEPIQVEGVAPLRRFIGLDP